MGVPTHGVVRVATSRVIAGWVVQAIAGWVVQAASGGNVSNITYRRSQLACGHPPLTALSLPTTCPQRSS